MNYSRRLILAFALPVLVYSLFDFSPAIAAGDHGTLNENTRFSHNRPGASWPPQPRSRTNERRFAPGKPAASKAQSSVSAPTTRQARKAAMSKSATTTAALNPQVRNALGQRYAHIGTRVSQGKWKGSTAAAQQVVVFFSHSNNQTVRVHLEAGGIERIQTSPASENQPPLAQNEMDQAVILARQWWQAQSDTRIDALTGYAIQTYQPNGHFHDTRMVYVSFHTSAQAKPERLTWIDLSAGLVIRGEKAQ